MHNMAPPLKWSDPDLLEAKVESYFSSISIQRIAKDDSTNEERTYTEWLEPPTLSGLAVHLGTNRVTLLNYSEDRRIHKGLTPEQSRKIVAALSRARSICERYTEGALFDRNKASGAQFALKNNYHGWHDKQEIVQTTTQINVNVDLTRLSNEELAALRQLARKYTLPEGGDNAQLPAPGGIEDGEYTDNVEDNLLDSDSLSL
jgi:hypothetical protein